MFKIVQKSFDIIFKQCFAIISSFIVKYNSKTGWPGNIFISGDAIHSSYLQSYGCTACGFQCKLWNIRRLSLDHTLFNWKIIPYCLRWPYSNWWNWQIKSTESSGRKLYTVGTDEHSPIKLQSYVTHSIFEPPTINSMNMAVRFHKAQIKHYTRFAHTVKFIG